MSSILSWTKRRNSRFSEAIQSSGVDGDSDHKIKIAEKVIQATSPDLDKPSATQLAEIVRHISSRETAETGHAVRALKHRLEDVRPRVVLNTLTVADHILRNLVDSRTATVNFRSYLESLLLPHILLLAKGQSPTDDGPTPKPIVRNAALRTLEGWASPSFLHGALLKKRVYAEAYRDASLHTPSPPAPSASASPSNDAITPKRRTSISNGTSSRMHSLLRASTPNAVATTAVDPVASGNLTAPKDDGAFVKFYRQRLVSFDTLHVVNKVPLTDKRIKGLRAFIEGHFERLRELAERSGNADHRTYSGLVQYAQSKLRTFPDYKPPNGSSTSTTSAPAPPPYPPPPVKRPGRRPSCDSISGLNTLVHQTSPQQLPPSHPTPQQSVPPHSTPLRTSGPQRRMLMSLAATFASPSPHPHMPQPHWAEPHFANLPVDLVSVPGRPQADASSGRLPSIPQPPPSHQGIPPPHPTQQTQPMHYQMPRPQPGMYVRPPHVMPAQHPHAHPYQYAQYPSSSLM